VEGGTTEWWGGSKSIRVKIAKACAHWDTPQFYPLQEKPSFFCDELWAICKIEKWRKSAKNFFHFCEKMCCKKTLVFL
jgi:hypothetical protein